MVSFSWAVPLLVCLTALAPAAASPLPATNGPRKFDLTLTWERHAPDGFTREMVLTNGQFPGPTLELNQGDDVEVTVHNKLPFNTTIHYHGIEMKNTPWSDGVPGLSQRLIPPGGNFVYKWTATQYGSHWYHAHERGQIDDGLYGPIVIHPRPDTPTPFSLITNDSTTLRAMEAAVGRVRPLVLSDFTHIPSPQRWDDEMNAGIEMPCYDSILFNGKGSVNCWPRDKINALTDPLQGQLLKGANATQLTDKACLPATVIETIGQTKANFSAVPKSVFDTCTPTSGSTEVIDVEATEPGCDTWLALDVIGAFGLLTGIFSIDGLPMHIYAVDGAFVQPQLVEAISITNGDRFSVLVRLDKPGRHTIRFASTASSQNAAGYAVLEYHDANSPPPAGNGTSGTPYINDKGANTTADVVFFNQAAMKAVPPAPVGQDVAQTFKLHMRIAGASWAWALNDSVYPLSADSAEPLLFRPHPDEHNNVTLTTHNNTWVDLVFIEQTFPNPPHPIHKHGTKMYLLGSGEGEFNYSSVAEAARHLAPGTFNFVDPPVRDGLSTPVAATGPVWMAVRYHVTNPGAWLLHCHIQSHLLGGMSAAIQDGIDKWPKVPQEYLNY